MRSVPGTQQRVAWVTGASRGVGRGVAVALGAAGWTVYVTARSSDGHLTGHLPGTVEDTADAVSAAGGKGVALACDHRDDEAVRAVAERIGTSHGRLDLLVNNVWGGYERINAGHFDDWNAPMWEQPLGEFDAMFASGVRAHYVALALCARLLIATPRSLVVTISFESSGADTSSPAYSMAKAADDRLAQVSAHQLAEHKVASVSLHPGWVRTEGVMQFADQVDLSGSQSPDGVGRAIVALAADPALLDLTGQVLGVDGLAERYGIDVTS
jgi:dehydrogenase/reductase SDR family member 1